jgi:hypothetical protein
MERCTELQTQLSRLGKAQDNQEKARILGARRDELEERKVLLTRLAAAASILLEHRHLAPKQFPAVDTAQESRAVVRERLDTDPETLTTGRGYATFIKRLDKINHTLRNQVSSAWSDLVRRHEGGDERFLAQVEQVPGQAEAVAAIRLARTELERASAQEPVSEEQYADFLGCSRNLQRALAGLQPDDFPVEVLRFFKQAQSVGGAPLSLLTEDVRAWLERKGMLERLRIRFDGKG